MTTQLDFQVGMAKESTYGTAVTVTRFPEAPAKAKYDVKTIKGKGLRPTKGVARTSRHAIVGFEGSGEIPIEAPTKGLGFLLNAVMGAVTNTVIGATAAYQQNHTLSVTDPHPTYTVQEALPFLGGGAVQPHTFVGCAFDSLEIAAKEGDFVQTKFAFMAQKLRTDVAAAAASYPTGDALLTFAHGAIGMAGTLTEPTTSALASLSGAAAVNIADVSVSVKRNLDKKGMNLGGGGYRSRAPQLGRPEVTGKITAEYTDNTLRDAYLAQTSLPLVLTFTHDVEIATGIKPVLQVVLPAIRLKGEVPTSNDGEPITQSIDFEAFDNGTASQSIWIVYRTLDTTP